MLILGEVNNCEKCGSQYSQYNNNPNNNFVEMWCQFPLVEHTIKNDKSSYNFIIKKPKGICQFCNPKSNWYLDKK